MICLSLSLHQSLSLKPETIIRKEQEKETKTIAILDAAEAVMREEGLLSLSINKVAKKAKIAKGTVYLYFENKEDIIGSITIRAREKLLDYFKKYCDDKTDPIEKIKGIFWADYYFYKEEYTYHELVSFYEQNTGLIESGHLAETSYAIAHYLEGIIENAKTAQAIRQNIDAPALTFVFWGMVVGILQIVETKQEQLTNILGKSEIEFYRYFVDSTVDGLRS